jgi:tetratricopeptide (TPR) repeat protein
MEWVGGITLREILNKRKKQNEPFTLIEAGNIISQLTTTLHYAHKYTVHRDIKPENILVETDEDKDKVQKDLTNIKIRLTDFGIAKMLSPGVFTTASIQMGTPYYMAPEQKTDAATVDKRADIYALGVVLFELLTLENTIGLELPSEINRELPKEINNVTKKAVATKPDMRYGDINDLLADLDKIIVEDKRRIEEERKNEKELKGQEGESISAQSQEAIESCKDPDDAEAHYNLAHAYLKSGKLKKAIKPLKQAVRIGPFALAHYNLGSAYRNSDKLKKAIESFKQAIGIKPDHALAHYYLGVVYLNSGKLKKAIESYKQAIRINPDDALFHINLGVAYGRSGMYKKAIESLKQAIRIEPDSAWAHKDLGCAYHELGMQKEAIESYKQAIRLDPDYAWVQKDIEAIEMEGDAGNQAWRDFLK